VVRAEAVPDAAVPDGAVFRFRLDISYLRKHPPAFEREGV